MFKFELGIGEMRGKGGQGAGKGNEISGEKSY